MLSDVTSIAEKLRDHERRKEERRVIQMKNARAKARALKEKAEREAASAEGAEIPAEESKMDISEEEAVNAANAAEKRKGEDDADAGPSKKPKYAEDAPAGDAGDDDGAEIGQSVQDAQGGADAGTKEEATGPAKPYEEPDVAWSRMTLTKPSPEMRGHTSYLTFATLYPAAIRKEMAA